MLIAIVVAVVLLFDWVALVSLLGNKRFALRIVISAMTGIAVGLVLRLGYGV